MTAEVATSKQCRQAVEHLAASVGSLDDETRSRHLPRRTVACTVRDLGVVFAARVDETGVHDIDQVAVGSAEASNADVRVSLTSDDLVALAGGQEDFLSAWLRGRVQVSAPMRDMLRLRSLFGLI